MEFTTSSNKINSTSTMDFLLSFSTWIVYESISVLLIVTSFYIFAMLLRYSCVQDFEKLKNRSRRVSLTRSESGSSTGVKLERSLSATSIGSVKRRSRSSRLSAKPLLALCLMGSFFAFLRVAADQIELATYGGERINCKLYQIVVIVTYSLSATCLYTALWTRLGVFYGHPIMKNLYSRPIKLLVWFALFCIVASALLNTAIFLITVTSVDSQYGCILGETTSISPTVRYVILVLSTVISQTLLLSLFLFPLIKHRSNVKSYATRSRTASSVSQTSTGGKTISNFGRFNSIRSSATARQAKKAKREKRLIAVIWRVLLTAVVCVISDVAASVITIVLTDEPRVVTNMVFNLNLIVNVVSVLRSFGDWNDRIAPCYALKKSSFKKKLAITIPPKDPHDPQDAKSPTTPKHQWRNVVESPDYAEKEATFTASVHESNESKVDSVSA